MRATRLAVGLAAGMLAGGCGDGGGEPLTKAGFLTRGNAVCARTQQAIDEGARATFTSPGNVPTAEEVGRFVDDTLLPQMRRELRELGELEPPQDDRDRVNAILGAGRQGVERISTNPGIVLDKERNPLILYSDLADAYGLEGCGRNSDETARALAGLKPAE